MRFYKKVLQITPVIASLLLLLASCIKKDVDVVCAECDIVDIDVEVLCNRGIYPIPIETRAVKKEAIMLRLDFDVDSATGYSQSKLKDRVEAIQVIAKSPINSDITPEQDITPYFAIKNNGMDELSTFSLDYYFSVPLDLILLLEPDEGAHEFEVKVIFGSGREIKKSMGTIYLI